MQQRMRVYVAPKKRNTTIRFIGEGYHISARQGKVPLVEVNADHWKTWVHERLRTPEDTPGALAFFHAPPREHYYLVRQLTAEKQVQETKADRDIVRWERIRRNNHYLDCAYLAAAAGHFCGVRLLGAQRASVPISLSTYFADRQRGRRLTTDDGRPFLITERAV